MLRSLLGPALGAILALAASAPILAAPSPSPLSTPVSAATDAAWSDYANARYGFAVSYPTAWGPAEEADNGDGIRLQAEDLPAQVMVYAAFDLGDDAPVVDLGPMQTEPVVIASGQTATLTSTSQAGSVSQDLVLTQDGQEYHVLVSGPESFLQANQDVVRALMGSLQVNA